MTDFRALCAELLNSLETLHKQSVTTPHNQTLGIRGRLYTIPIGNDILAQDCLRGDLIKRARAALAAVLVQAAEGEPKELQWPASVAQGCHEAAADAESGSPLQQLLVAAGDLLERGHPLSPAAITVTGGLTAARVTHSPTAWRLARRNGELILQAGSLWVQGRESGIEWNDVPTVNLDEQEAQQ